MAKHPIGQQFRSLDRRIPLLIGMSLLSAGVVQVLANPPSGGSYVMQREAIAGGGSAATGGTFVLVGTAGQAAAQSTVSGGSYVLDSGFHIPRAPAAPLPDAVFRDSFE